MASSQGGPVQLVLAGSSDEQAVGAPWIGRLLTLGTRAARCSRRYTGRQLIVALSVPRRDYAACLVGCGWVLASKAPTLPEPLAALRGMEPGQPVRAVNSRQVVTGFFSRLDEEDRVPAHVHFAGSASAWRVDNIRALALLAELDQPEREPRPEPCSLEQMAQLDLTWDARLAKPAADLAIVGTLAWLEEELEAQLARENDRLPPSTIGKLLMPKCSRAATWFTRLYASATLADNLPIPNDVKLVILDGNGAIQHLAEIQAPVVICVLDRSVADETGAELLVQQRNTRGEPVSVAERLGWRPPAGVEVLGFTVAL